MLLPTELTYPIIAIGDLHGRVEWLQRLISNLERHPVWPTAKLVFLGDYVDRCPSVRDLVDLVIRLIKLKPGSTALMGNHDRGLSFATGISGQQSPYWMQRYGEVYDHKYTFQSYLGRGPEYYSREDWVNDLQALKTAIPHHHRDFFASLPWCATAEGHLFLHNGLSNELEISAEEQVHCLKQKLWTRETVRPKTGTKSEKLFTDEYPVWLGAARELSANPLPHPRLVQVSGHDQIESPDANSVRIRIDTSGGRFEPLTGCILRGPTHPPEFVLSNE